MNSQKITTKRVTYATSVSGMFLATVLLLAPSLAMAQNGSPHFVGSAKATANPDHSVTVAFKIAGLAAGSITSVTLTAGSVEVKTQCVNPGGNPPPPKTTTFGTTSTTGNFGPAPKNGNIAGQITLPAPTVTPDQAGCPPNRPGQTSNWTVQVISVTYKGLTISSPTAGTGTVTPSTITA